MTGGLRLAIDDFVFKGGLTRDAEVPPIAGLMPYLLLLPAAGRLVREATGLVGAAAGLASDCAARDSEDVDSRLVSLDVVPIVPFGGGTAGMDTSEGGGCWGGAARRVELEGLVFGAGNREPGRGRADGRLRAGFGASMFVW